MTKLSPRERQVADLLATGVTNGRKLASAMGIAPGTVEVFIRTAFRKLGLNSRAALASWAIEHPATETKPIPRFRTHPEEFRIWAGMRARCNGSRKKEARWYADRGIKVCERWQTFANFVEDMGRRPPGMSLDRIDNNGNYEPGNVRWANTKEQARNTRRNRFIEFRGERLCIADWAEILGVTHKTLSDRIKRHGITALAGVRND